MGASGSGGSGGTGSTDAERHRRHARSFGEVAEAYDRGRPGYPLEAAQWLTGPEPLSVLELGAGTGKLTQRLVELGHDVHATDPDEGMLAVLRERLPDVRATSGSAEEIPAPDDSFDVVVAAQCFHWFDVERALPEIRRVLKPRGRFSVVYNRRDERIPWVKRLGRIIGTQDHQTDPTEPLQASLRFIIVEQQAFAQWQHVDRRSIVDLVTSRSNIAVLSDAEREERLAQVLGLYDEYGRGMDGMQLPYDVQCFRSRVVKSSAPPPAPTTPDAATTPTATDGTGTGSSDADPPTPPPGDDDGTLLIDFR